MTELKFRAKLYFGFFVFDSAYVILEYRSVLKLVTKHISIVRLYWASICEKYVFFCCHYIIIFQNFRFVFHKYEAFFFTLHVERGTAFLSMRRLRTTFSSSGVSFFFGGRRPLVPHQMQITYRKLVAVRLSEDYPKSDCSYASTRYMTKQCRM